MSVGVAIIGSGMSAIYTRPTVMSLELIKSQASSLAKSIWYVICFVICGSDYPDTRHSLQSKQQRISS